MYRARVCVKETKEKQHYVHCSALFSFLTVKIDREIMQLIGSGMELGTYDCAMRIFLE